MEPKAPSNRAPRNKSLYIYTSQTHQDPRTILNALVSGVDISFVDPNLYPQIKEQIPNYILKFQDRRDEEAVNKLKFIDSYIDKYPERQRFEMMLTKRKKPDPVKREIYSNEDLNKQVNSILRGTPSQLYYTTEESEAIINELKRRKTVYAEQEEYDKADYVNRATNQFIKLCECSESNKMQSEKAADLKQKLEEAEKNHEDLKQRWKQVFDTFYAKSDREYQEMTIKNQEEIDNLENQKSQKVPPKYNKYSAELLDLKKRNSAMVSSKRYDEATRLQIEIQKLQKLEDQKNVANWINLIDDQIDKAVDRQQKELTMRNNANQREEKTMRKMMKIELDSSEKFMMNLKKSIKLAEDQIYTMEMETDNANLQKTKSCLPPLNTNTTNIFAPQEPMTPNKFRQRALLNMRVYTKRPPTKPPMTVR